MPQLKIHVDAPEINLVLLLLALTLTRGTLYALLNPPFGSPDERDHFQYVQTLATSGLAGERGAEGHQPVPYYAMMVPAYWVTVGQPPAVQDLAIRLASLPLLAGIVLFTWLAARKLAPDRPFVAIVAAAFVGLHPQLAYIGASANNDTAANFMGAVLTYLVVSLLTTPTPWTAPVTALALGVALMTKGQILPVVAMSATVLLVYTARRAFVDRPREFLLCLGVGAAALTFALGTEEGGNLVARSQQHLSFLVQGTEVVEVASNAGTEPLPYFSLSFWAAFLGESVHPSILWYVVPTGVVVATPLAYVLDARRGKRQGDRTGKRTFLLLAVLLSLIVAQWLAVYVRYLYAYQNPDDPWRLQVLQGRFLLAALVPLGLVVARGWGALLGYRGWTPGAVGIVAAFAALDAASLTSLAGRYGWPFGS